MSNHNKIINIDHKNLLTYLKDKIPYIFIEKAEVAPGEYARGIKNFAYNEWFFKCHFEDEPIVPGVFLLESLMQTAALAIHTLDIMENKKIVVKKFINVNIINGVFPGDQLYTFSKIKTFKRGIINASGEGYVIRDGKQVPTIEADFQMLVPDLLQAFTPLEKDTKNVKK